MLIILFTIFSGAIFLTGVTGIFFITGFGYTLSALRKGSPKLFNKCSVKIKDHNESGIELALRALRWGSFYSTVSCTVILFGVIKASGATSFEEFRENIGKLLPLISRNTASTK